MVNRMDWDGRGVLIIPNRTGFLMQRRSAFETRPLAWEKACFTRPQKDGSISTVNMKEKRVPLQVKNQADREKAGKRADRS
jgi:hypothetical protein